MTTNMDTNIKNTCRVELQRILSEDIDHIIKREESLFDELTEPFSGSLVLFGAGGLGRKTLDGLQRAGVTPLAFADNNSDLWGTNVGGIQVLSPEEAARQFGNNAAFVVTIWRAGRGYRFADARRQLIGLKCAKVVSFASLFWKYKDIFLPYYALSLPHELSKQADLIESAFDLWTDDSSITEYLAQLRFRFYLDFDNLPSPVLHDQYFPEDLFKLKNDEVFIDCGAFDGDTVKALLETHLPAFAGQIFALEPDPLNLQHLRDYVFDLDDDTRSRMTILPSAVGANCGKVSFESTGTASSVVNQAGSLLIDCVSLDEILKNVKPTFIKMDIEGAELDALTGASRLIRENAPILAISVYHRPDDLWRIPLMMASLSSRYQYFLRAHNEEGWDLVCYAVPDDRIAVK